MGLAVLMGVACEPERTPDAASLPSNYASIRTAHPTAATAADCQQDSVLLFVPWDSIVPPDTFHVFHPATAADMPLVTRIANLPEYHDCQRFVVPSQAGGPGKPSGFEYGPLVAIWAADSLGARFPSSIAPARRDTGWSMAVPVAVIYNFEPNTTYAPLHIAPFFSCLYLWHDAGTPRNWRAAIVSLGRTPIGCQEPATPESLEGHPLKVIPAPTGHVRPPDIPEVARWDWDVEMKQQYIGIRCGNQWCNIGSENLVPSRGAADAGMTQARMKSLAEPVPGLFWWWQHPGGTDEEIMRVVDVKGWYDQQQLDLPNPAGGTPQLTDIVGTVFPHPALGRAPFKDGRWTPAAYVNVTADYAGKVSLKKGVSRVYLCRDGTKTCKVPEGMTCPAESEEPMGSTGLNPEPYTTWYTKIVSEGGEEQYRCIKRRRHGGSAIPAAATRWNWSELDATTWVACVKGCFTAN